MKEWFNTLPADEQDRRHEFKEEFNPHYEGFRALRLGTARHTIEHRTGVAPATVTINGLFGVIYIGGPAERIPLSETRQIDDPNLAFLATANPIQPKWEDFNIEGQPLFPECREYLEKARALIEEGRRIAREIHDNKSLSVPPT
jgi:signal transduction histidine kinase